MNVLTAAAAIKEATQPLHTETESVLLPKLSSIQSAGDYAAILRMFYGFFHPLEQLIRRHLPEAELPDIEQRKRSTSILHDLEWIGEPVTGLSLCTDLPPVHNTAQAFGAMYVLEGSTLGGKMIARMLQGNTSLNLPADALSFFTGYREETGPKWKAFLEALNRQPGTGDMMQAANDTFFYLKRWMQQTLYNE